MVWWLTCGSLILRLAWGDRAGAFFVTELGFAAAALSVLSGAMANVRRR